jgi:hypothetical protein
VSAIKNTNLDAPFWPGHVSQWQTVLLAARLTKALALCTSCLRKYRSPRLVMPPILLTLPEVCCLGVSPNHTANSLGLLNAWPLSMAANKAIK